MTWEEAVEWLKSQPDKQDLIKAVYYDEPLIEAARRFARGEEWLGVEDILKEWVPGKVLDLGAGHGITSYAFAKSGCRVTALEPDSSRKVGTGAIKGLARESGLNINVVQGFAEQLPFDKDAFDIVYGRQVMHHASDLSALCTEAARVLRPGGAFLMTREHVISKKDDLPRFLESHPLHNLYGGENAMLLSEYEDAITSAGLSVIKVYSPHESVINHFPMTKEQKRAELIEITGRYMGRPLARALGGIQVSRKMILRLLSLVDNTPGRLYSFVAVKKHG
jgi:SAM-dependent methyltransferase